MEKMHAVMPHSHRNATSKALVRLQGNHRRRLKE
jgi:hypothetical protein